MRRGVGGCVILLAAAAGIYFAAFYRPGPVEVQDDFEKGFSPVWNWEVARPDAARIVPDPWRPGNQVALFSLKRDDPLIDHAKRVEMGLGCVGLGEAYRYVFEVCLPNDYPTDVAADNIVQWHDMPDFILGESWRSPSLKLMIRDGRWVLSHRWCLAKVNRFFWEKDARDLGEEIDLGQAETGKWVRWEFRVLWAWNANGELQIWRDGRSVYQKRVPTAYRDWRGPYFKIGMYKPEWSAPNGVSSVNERRIYFDNVEVRKIPATEVLTDN